MTSHTISSMPSAGVLSAFCRASAPTFTEACVKDACRPQVLSPRAQSIFDAMLHAVEQASPGLEEVLRAAALVLSLQGMTYELVIEGGNFRFLFQHNRDDNNNDNDNDNNDNQPRALIACWGLDAPLVASGQPLISDTDHGVHFFRSVPATSFSAIALFLRDGVDMLKALQTGPAVLSVRKTGPSAFMLSLNQVLEEANGTISCTYLCVLPLASPQV